MSGNINFICIRLQTGMNSLPELDSIFFPVSKSGTNKFDICGQYMYIVYQQKVT